MGGMYIYSSSHTISKRTGHVPTPMVQTDCTCSEAQFALPTLPTQGVRTCSESSTASHCQSKNAQQAPKSEFSHCAPSPQPRLLTEVPLASPPHRLPVLISIPVSTVPETSTLPRSPLGDGPTHRKMTPADSLELNGPDHLPEVTLFLL